MTAARRWLGVLLAAGCLWGCPKQEEVIVATAADYPISDQQIDSEPLNLLPGGAVGLAILDAKQLFGSQFGQRLLEVVKRRTPIPAAAGFEPSRDLEKLALGFYSMQGADFVGVAQGSFNKEAIETAAQNQGQTPLGVPVVATDYAGRKLYTAQDMGFSVLTSRTVLVGNQTGMRRALDRMQEGRVRRQIPGWMDELIQGSTAPIAAGFDLRAQPITDAARGQFPFLAGLETGRMLGNFQPPGINLAGTMTYEDEAKAQAGAASLTQISDLLKNWGWLAALMGIVNPVKQLQAQAQGKDAKFVAGLDGDAVGQLLDKAAAMVPQQNQ